MIVLYLEIHGVFWRLTPSDPMHPSKKGSITILTSPNVHDYLIAYDCTGHVEGFLHGE